MCKLCSRLLENKVNQQFCYNSATARVISTFLKEAVKCPAMKALENLTPSGSEFYEDPQFCFRYVRHRMHNQFNLLKNKMIEIKNLKAQLQSSRKDDNLELIGRTCKHCGKQFNGTAFGMCSQCGRFQ